MGSRDAETIEQIAVSDLVPYAMNARVHDEGQVAQIAASIKEFGFVNPVLIDADNGIVAGHGRVMACRMLGRKTLPAIRLGHLSDAQRRALIIADNRLAELASWDAKMLATELDRLKGDDFPIAVTGYSAADVDDLITAAGLQSIGVTRGGDPDDGGGASTDLQTGVLELLTVSIGEPKTKVEAGERWQIGPHDLLIESVVEGHTRWAPFLRPESKFCPFPGVFLPFAKAEGLHMVLVQPDPYVAGHMIDRYAEVHGAGSVKRVAP